MNGISGRGLKMTDMVEKSGRKVKNAFSIKDAERTENIRKQHVDLKNEVCEAKSLTIDNGSVWSAADYEYVNFLPMVNKDNLRILQSYFLCGEKESIVSNKEDIAAKTDPLKEDIPSDEIQSTKNTLQPLCNDNNISDFPEDINILWNSDDSVNDPDFDGENDDHDSDESNVENVVQKKGRKRKASPEKWKCNKAKRLRNTGKEYISKFTGKMVAARCLRSPCVNCKYNCTAKVDQAFREKIFQEYWKMADLSRQREFIIRHMEEIRPAYRYPKNETPRKLNSAFYFEKEGQKIRVCKKFFMSTLDINRRIISTSCSKKQDGFMLQDLRGKHHHHKTVDETIKNDIRTHINSIPRIESHYLRAQTTKEFIEGGKTIAGIFRDYVDNCKEQGKPYGNLTMFTRIFNNEFNISFFIPKKDQCDLCVAFENTKNESANEELLEKYNRHLEEKKISRIEKDKDKENRDTNVIVASYDLQAALITPRGEVSVFYYKTKLSTYNFTIYELKTKQAYCNVWHEGEAGRGSNEIASCVLRYIEEKAGSTDEDIHFIFYSDNCSGQQKNKYVFMMYIYAVCKFKNVKSISHKFLIKGHTQNEGDAVHSTIEKEVTRSLKSGPIYTPAQYVQLMRMAKKKAPFYKVYEYTHEDFLDFKHLSAKFGKNFSINTEYENIQFNDMKVFKVEQENPFEFSYKNSYLNDFKKVNIYQEKRKATKNDTTKTRSTTKSTSDQTMVEYSLESKIMDLKSWNKKRAYMQPAGIPVNKKKDLINLVNGKYIPRIYFDFYNSLKTEPEQKS